MSQAVEIGVSASAVSADAMRLARGVITVAVVLLCGFGVYESVDATISVFSQTQPASDVEALFDYPMWALLHFIPGLAFMALTPFQLWAGFRNRHRLTHRVSGRIVVVSGVFLGVSGLALPLTMPGRPLSEDVFMVAFFAAFLFFLGKAFTAAKRRAFARHREWVIRMFATGLTITTQRLLLVVFIATAGIADTRDFWDHFVSSAWLAWLIHIAVAEWWISVTRTARQTRVA